jgi:hypothetical protein
MLGAQRHGAVVAVADQWRGGLQQRLDAAGKLVFLVQIQHDLLLT